MLKGMMMKRGLVIIVLAVLAILIVAGCQPQTIVETVEVEKVVEVEKEVEVVKEVEVEKEVEVVVTATPAPALGEVVQDYEGELIISTWGGVTEEWIRTNEPAFHEIYPNVEVIYDIGGSSARLNKLIAQAANPEIDLFISNVPQVYTAAEAGILAKINPANVPNMEGLYDWAKPYPQYGAAWGAISLGLCYNPEYFADDPITSWGDLWRPDVQGKISVPAIGHGMMPHFMVNAAELNGGSTGNIDPGLDALARLQPAAQHYFYTGWNAQYEAGDVVLAADFDIYCYQMAADGVDIEYIIPEEGVWGALQYISMIKGSENQEMAEFFMNILFSPEVQQSVAVEYKAAPAMMGIEVPAEFCEKEAACGDTLPQVRYLDPGFVAGVRAGWTELMNEKVAPVWGE